MKQYPIKIVSLLLLVYTLFGCQNDDDTTIDPTTTTPETLDVATIIEVITNNSSDGVWEIEQALLVKQNNNNVTLTGSYVVRDDVFTFTEGANQTIQLHWKKGYDINLQAQNMLEAGTDRNASSENFVINIDAETGILSTPDNRITGSYVQESGEITLIIGAVNSNDTLNLNMNPKNQSEYLSIPTTLSNPQELFSFSTGVPRVGFKVSQSQNSLYITNRNDLEGLGAQQAFKYDLSNHTATSIEFTLQDFATKNIEFIDGKVLSLGGARFQALDYELTGVESFIEIDPFTTLIFNGTASLDDTVYTFGNYDNSNIISTWRIGDASTQPLATIPAPSDIAFMDGEVIDQVLYIFGGWDSDFDGSDTLYTYHIDTGAQNQIQLPVIIQQAYTSTVENLIYVLGVRPFNSEQNQQKVFGVYNTLDSSFEEISTDSLDVILVNKNIEQFQVTGNKVYFVTSENLGAPNGYTNSVYEATLN